MLTQLPAGADRKTSGPRSEKRDLAPLWRSPPMPSTPGQLAGSPTAWPLLLPAAATTTAWYGAAEISATALRYASPHRPSPPRLRLSTRAGVALAGSPASGRPAAQYMPAMMSLS
jgi:hypothetical protein